MAQWDFVVSWKDVWCAIDSILDRPGTTLVHDSWYKTNEATYYSSMNPEMQSAIRAFPSLYISGEDFTTMPISMDLVGKGSPDSVFHIRCSAGGPLLGLSMAGEYSEKGKPIIPPSTLSYSDEYLNTKTGNWEKPSPELKAAYKDIQRIMKLNMIRHKGPSGFVWIGKDAFQMLKGRRATTSYYGLRF